MSGAASTSPVGAKKVWRTLVLGVVVSAAALYLVFRRLDWVLVAGELRKADVRYLPLLIACTIVFGLTRAIRWQLLLPVRGLKFRELTDVVMMGLFAAGVLPLRAGEMVRPWLTSRLAPVSFSAALASTVAERVFDAVALFSLLAWSLWQLKPLPAGVIAGVRGLAALTALLAGMLLFCYWKPDVIRRLIHGWGGRLLRRCKPDAEGAVLASADHFLKGFCAIRGGRELVRVLFWTYASWGVSTLWYQAGLLALGVSLPWSVALRINVFVASAAVVPSAVANVGTYQAGCVAALMLAGGSSFEFAAAYAVVMHVLELAILAAIAAASWLVAGKRYGRRMLMQAAHARVGTTFAASEQTQGQDDEAG